MRESTPKPSVARRHACQPPVAAARGPYPVSDAGCTLRPSLRAAVVPSLPGAARRRLVPLAQSPEGPGRGPGGVREVDDRGIEPRSTAVSERRLPSRPVVDEGRSSVAATRAGLRTVGAKGRTPRASLTFAIGISDRRFRSCVPLRRRQGIAPCLPGSQPGGSLLAVRRSLAGRSRTPVPPR